MNRNRLSLSLTFVACFLATAPTTAAYLLEIDTDGADDGVLTFNPNFAFGGDTTTASQSVAASAFGLTGGDSIFGGDGVAELDTYLYSYDPTSDADNLVIPAGTDLSGSGDLASGLAGGLPGVYAVYATWPATTGVSGGLVTYDLLNPSGAVVATTQIDQNGLTGLWVELFEAPLAFSPLDPLDDTFTLRQTAGANTFVSQRAAAVLFEYVGPIPEPSAALLTLVASAALLARGSRATS